MEDKYIIVTTICDKKEIADKIINTLLDKKLVAASQTTEINSKYLWNDAIEISKEIKIELRTKLSLYKEIEDVIKSIHDYEVCEVSYYEINGSKEFLDWIKDSTI